MKFFDTLFDMLGLKDLAPAKSPQRPAKPQREQPPRPRAQPKPRPVPSPAATENRLAPSPAHPLTSPSPSSSLPVPRSALPSRKAALYDTMTREMLQRYDIRVRKWRTSMSGVAWYVTYRDGSVQRLLESPKPKSPMSAAIFLHEVGHHAIGFNVYKPRCLEEYHAWQYSLAQMRQWNIPITPRVMQRYQRSMKYAVGKATRRGIRALPSELLPFAQ